MIRSLFEVELELQRTHSVSLGWQEKNEVTWLGHVLLHAHGKGGREVAETMKIK